MKGTRLWKPAGSPLIQGRSRRERSFFADWLSGMIVGLLGGSAVIVAVMVFNGTDLSTSLRAVWLPAIPAAMFGSAAGVSIGRHFGWHPRWVSGAVFAAILAIAATIGFVMFVVSQLGG